MKRCFLFSSDFHSLYHNRFGSIHPTCQLIPPIFISCYQNVYLEPYTRIQGGVHILNSERGGKVIIKRYSAISAGCIIVPGCHVPTVGIPHFFSNRRINDVDNTIVIEEDVWVGTGVRILSKSSVGRGVIVGAGSVVTKSIPPYAVVAGVPAKIVAVKFSVDQILAHEKRLYEPEKRFSKEYLETLFAEKYKGVKVLGQDLFSENELDELWKTFK